jgi:hypothetical protein
MMTAKLLFTAATLLASASALPRLAARDDSTAFRLAIDVIDDDLTPSVQGLELSAYTIGTCIAEFQLASQGQGTVFWTNGNTTAVNGMAAPAGIVLTPGGTATVPAGNPVEVVCRWEDGTSGVTIDQDPAVPGAGTSLQVDRYSWMACPAAEINANYATPDGAIVLASKQDGQRTLEGCADVRLLPVCDSTVLDSDVVGAKSIQC